MIMRYTVFSAVATVANLLAQRVILAYDQSLVGFVAAVGVGTAVGLIAKYILDKHWIFYDDTTGFKSHGQKLFLYAATGLITTLIFWGTETAFWLVWHADLMREAGAIVGLTVGYVIKYQLDRRYVFTDARLTERVAA
jgi:putative flippase GtrA